MKFLGGYGNFKKFKGLLRIFLIGFEFVWENVIYTN